TVATFTMSGNGYGEVLNDDGHWQLRMSGTNAKSAVTIKTTNGLLDLYDVSVPSSLKGFAAPTTDLMGSFLVDGSLGTLSIANMVGATAVVRGTLGATTIANMQNNSVLMTNGNIASVTVNSMSASSIYAGVLSAGRPVAAGDFNPAVSIGSFTIKKGPVGLDTFVGSTVAAASIKTVSIRNVNPAGVAEFGIIARSVKSYTRFQDKLTQAKLSNLPFGVSDNFLGGATNFMVRIV
ncbi:MAG: hypothetical protein PHU85_18455, partial [Phycisphaerae bacterium]|nr:hypothetical protein [Phycisphaerae bacterium]